MATSFAQDSAGIHNAWRGTLGKVFSAVQQHSVYRQQVDWQALEQRVLSHQQAPLSFEDFKLRIRQIFSGMGDPHGALFVKGERIGANDSTRFRLRPALMRELTTARPALHTAIIEGNYGYLLVPPNKTGDNLQRLGQALQDSLCVLLRQPLKGIVLDLRANEGGSILPLFSGLQQLIGEGTAGGFSNLQGSFKTAWKLKKGKFYQQGRIVASVKQNCAVAPTMNVAVLLSPVTASAGEMLAIALKGRSHTIFIGEKTSGLTTGNVTLTIDGYLLAVSASLSEDRQGRTYLDAVKPDIEIIEGDHFSDLSQDKKIAAAIRWFRSLH